jgi:hypothetical protein
MAEDSTNPKPRPEKTAKQLRGELDYLLQVQGKSVTPKTDDPKETEKLGPPLTAGESLRLHELHGLLASPDDVLYRQRALSAEQAKKLRELIG